MANTRFVLGVDLDGVCADFYGGLRKFAAEWLDVPITKLKRNVTYGLAEWKLDTAGGYKELHRFAVTQRDLFRKLRPMRGCSVTLRRLSEKEVHIRIITHRLFINYFHQEAARQTIEWLDHYGIPYRDLCFMEDKGAVGADLYIDDAPDNIIQLRKEGHQVIIFSNSTNRDLPGLRADSWREIERMALREQSKWKKRLEGQEAE